MIRNAIVISIIFFNLAGHSYSQERVKKFHIGLSVTPQLSKQVLGSSWVEGKESRFCYGLGGNLIYDMSARVQLHSGIVFQRAKINYRDYSPLFPSDVKDGQGLPYNSYWNLNYSHLFLGIPLSVKWKLFPKDKANHFFLHGGFRLQQLIATNGYVQLVESGNAWEKRDLNSYQFKANKTWGMITVGPGYEWKLAKGKMTVSPVYENTFTQLYREASTAGVNGSLRFLGVRLMYY